MKFTFHAESKQRLDIFLRAELAQSILDSREKSSSLSLISLPDIPLSNAKIRRMIIAGAVSVDGRQIRRPSYELLRGQPICVEFDKEKFFFEKQADDIAFDVTAADVLYEDDDLIAVNKPALPSSDTVIPSFFNPVSSVSIFINGKWLHMNGIALQITGSFIPGTIASSSSSMYC